MKLFFPIATAGVALLLASCETVPAPAAAPAPSTTTASAPAAPVSSLKETARLEREGASVIPYPFTTCAVIQREMNGNPKHRRIYQGHEILFCCTPCVRAFDSNPDAYMPRIVQAAAAKSAPTVAVAAP